MIQKSKSENGAHIMRGSGSLLLLSAILVAAMLTGGVAAGSEQAQSRPGAATGTQADTQPHSVETGGAKTREPSGRLSKFEARRFRHACQDKANERGLRGPERDSFLTRCFFGRRTQRAARRDCAKLGVAKGLEKSALHEFVRECVKEQRSR